MFLAVGNSLEVTTLGALDFDAEHLTFHQKAVALSASDLLISELVHEMGPSTASSWIQVWASQASFI